MREMEERAARAYAERFGQPPEIVASAPGRVNLIGEHTDYNGGFVLPYAIERRVAVAASRGDGGLLSTDFGELRGLTTEREGVWADYPRGVLWALREAGYDVPGFRAAFAGDVPRGASLSSSAAIEAATALALDALFGLGVDRKELAVLCRRAENEFVGVESGIMDQYASLLCKEGSALFVDCRSLEAEEVPLDVRAAGLSLLVCDTRVERGLGETGYNERRRQCAAAASTLGVRELRDAEESDLEKLSGDELRRARHIISENGRVLRAVEALRKENFAELGGLMYASHASLRDDFEISTPELDAFVETAGENGSWGARLTGGGFGGCAIALLPAPETEALKSSIRRKFDDERFTEPAFYDFQPSPGEKIVG